MEFPEDVVVLILDPEQTELAEWILKTANDLIDEVVARPREQNALFEKLPAGVRQGIAQRDSAGTGWPQTLCTWGVIVSPASRAGRQMIS